MNTYDSMASSPMSTGKELGWTAFIGSVVACSVWPELLMPIPAAKSGFLLKQLESQVGKRPIGSKTMNLPGGSHLGGLSGHASYSQVATSVPVRLKLIITDTGAMLQACSKIHESGQTGRKYLEDLNTLHHSVQPTTWAANDEEEYGKRLGKHRDAVVNTACLAEEAALLTAIIGTLRFAQHAISAVLAGVLGVMAAAFWVAMAIPVVGQGIASGIRTAGSVIAKILPRTIQIMDEVMTACGQGHAALLTVRTMQAGVSDAMRLETGGSLSDLVGAGGSTLVDVANKLMHIIDVKV